jgi:antitoxin (DNA-binding transcriptional repressor) of toxin-antitoxin stability system
MVKTMVKTNSKRTMAISEFRAKCLALMDEVAETGVPIEVTRRGKVVGEFRPVTPEEERLFLQGKLEEWRPLGAGGRKNVKARAKR